MHEHLQSDEQPAVAQQVESSFALSAEINVFDARAERQRDLLAKLEQGTEAILTSEGFRTYLTMAAKFHRYSFQNTILIMTQKPEATLVNSYERWKQLGRQVVKGEHGIKIFYPTFRKVEETDPDTGETTEARRLASFGVGNVFDVSQTEGESLPDLPDVRELSRNRRCRDCGPPEAVPVPHG